VHAAPSDTVVAYPGVYLGAGSFGSRIEAQRETARAYAARKGLTIVGEFSDEGSVPSLLAADRVRRRHLPLCMITDMLDSAPAVASVVVTGRDVALGVALCLGCEVVEEVVLVRHARVCDCPGHRDNSG
jgi:hypothetical protein